MPTKLEGRVRSKPPSVDQRKSICALIVAGFVVESMLTERTVARGV